MLAHIRRLLFSSLLIMAAMPAALAAPVMVSPADQPALAPDVVVGTRGEVYVLWLDKSPQVAAAAGAAPDPHGRHVSTMNLYFAKSTDDGRSFAVPVRVNDQAGEVWGFATSRPRMAVSTAGTVHVLWPANAVGPAGKPVLEMHYSRSVDRGASFAPARRLNSVVDSDMSAVIHGGLASAHAFQALLVRGSMVEALWIDTREMRSGDDNGVAYRTVSTDDGVTFGKDERVFGDVCPCCQLTAIADRDGRQYLGMRQVERDNFRQATVVTSIDGGRSFGAPVSTGGPRWQLDGCPLKPTILASDGRHVYTASFNGGGQPQGVYFAASSDHAQHFEPALALHPAAAVSDSPALAVGRRGTVHVVWHAKTGEVRRLFTRASTDHGRTFGPVTEIATPPGTASYPMLASGPRGDIYLIWQQGEQVWLDRLN